MIYFPPQVFLTWPVPSPILLSSQRGKSLLVSKLFYKIELRVYDSDSYFLSHVKTMRVRNLAIL